MRQSTVLWEERKREILTIVPFWGGVDMPSTRGRPAGDPRETRENTREGRRGANLNNRTVLGRHRGVRGEGIKSQKCASVPAYQQFSKIYTCVRARVYLWKLLVRWYAGTLAHPSVGGEAGCDCGKVSKQYSVHLETYFFLLFLRNYLRISFFCCIFAESFSFG